MFPTAVGLALPLPAGPATPAPRAQDPAPAKTVLVLTVEEAVHRALENNADLAVERFSPESALLAISDAESVYAPVVFSNISTQSRTSKATNSFAGADKVDKHPHLQLRRLQAASYRRLSARRLQQQPRHRAVVADARAVAACELKGARVRIRAAPGPWGC